MTDPQHPTLPITPTTNVLSSTVSPFPPVMPNLHDQLIIKLTSTNYLLWQTQLLPILKGYGLSHHIDGSVPLPPETLDNNQLNPAYQAWFCKDQLVLSWIVNSLSESLVL